MRSLLILPVLIVAVFVGCNPATNSGVGFSLPAGDADDGRALFVELKCTSCHSVQGIDFESESPADAELIALGGTKPYVTTYGDLVTSIINPSHRFPLGVADEKIKEGEESKMRIYNDELTVTQLVDLVTFLETRYKLKPYEPSPYTPYY